MPNPPADAPALAPGVAGGDAPPLRATVRRCRELLLGVAPRLLTLLDREAASPTRGSFDRVHWAWKFRDFPLTMWQASLMPLAMLHRHQVSGNPYFASAPLAHWLAGALEATLDRQHRNGAFDSFTPFSQDHGVTLAMVMTVATTVDTLGDVVVPPLRDRALDAMARACRFAARSDEDYAFISNHQAAFALAYARAGRLLGDGELLQRSDAVVATLLRRQSADGWFEEYGGADPGYETFALTYLALLQQERASAPLLHALERSVAFLAHCVHPDGSVGGHYGSRHTAQFAPGGLELLAPVIPMAGRIADHVMSRLDRGNVVTPLSCDDDNLPLLTFSYAVAALQAPFRPDSPASPPLPCERDDVLSRFDDSGIVVAATQRYFAVANLAKGGLIRAFARSGEELAYEDSGYLLRAGGEEWVSHLAGAGGHGEAAGDGRFRATAPFCALKHEVLTPFRFLLLRILNLTIFRSVSLGALVRRMIIARLITGRRRGVWRLRRDLAFEGAAIVITDEVAADEPRNVASISLERSLLPLHMGSAKYFHANELIEFGTPELAGWREALGRGAPTHLVQRLTFADGGVTIERWLTAPPNASQGE